jgi:hypothetical protein
MQYRVKISSQVAKKIRSWGLSDYLLVEIYLQLNERLPLNPQLSLRRTETPFEGMVFDFSLIDPENRLREHYCIFHILYGQDEQTLLVAQAGYFRRDGI